MDINRNLIDFISKCPTAFHTALTVSRILEDEGFELYFPGRPVDLGGRYYLVRNSSSVFAFTIPREIPVSAVIGAAHGDSPSFKLKNNFVLKRGGGLLCLNTEKYGGMELKSWFDTPLGVAGRLAYNDGDKVKTVLCDSESPVCIIPNTAVHLQRDREADLRNDLFALFASEDGGDSLAKLLCEKAGIKADQILGADLFLYNCARGLVWGPKGEFISAPRLDDLQCVYTCLKGFLDSGESPCLKLLAVFDNEEVGSSTKQGADSDVLETLVRSVLDSLGADRAAADRIISASFAVSADNAHAVHPNRPELNDPMDRPVLNGGVVVKSNANQRYTTDAVSGAVLKKTAQKAGVPIQYYSNRSDLPGGSTLGNIMIRHLSVDCVDIGAPQLAMHSVFETAGARDTESLYQLMKTVFSSEIAAAQDGFTVR